jgi:glutamine synthetase
VPTESADRATGPGATIALVAPDLNAKLRTRHIPAEYFEPTETPCFVDIVFAFDAADQIIPRPTDFTGWWPSWDDGFGDLRTHADLPSRRAIGWRDGHDVVFADLSHRDGSPVAVAPRQLLRRITDAVGTDGLNCQVGTEIEFFLGDIDSRAEADRTTDAYAFSPPRRDREAVDDIVERLLSSGIGVSSWYSEGGERQYEVALAHTDPLTAADSALLARYGIDEIARRHGLQASFSPKPGPGFGSGLHVHISVHDDSHQNLLRSLPTGKASSVGSHAVAGLLEILQPAAALLTPTPSGYHRLQPHTAAGTTATWAHDNRSAGIRFLDRNDQARVEVRTAASDANPYLVLAALLAGIKHGTESEVALDAPGTGDLYAHAAKESALPADLASATQALRDSTILNQQLGRDFIEHYAATRLWAADLTHRP